MEEMWKNSAIIAKRNVDDNQNPISVQLYELKPVIDVHSCIVLNQLPDEFHGIEIEGFTQVYDIDKISTKNFKVDYANGVLYFHPNNIGKMLTINYYGIGCTLLSASRIYTKYDKHGNVLETLEEFIDKAKLYIKAIESLGGAVEVINKLDADIKAGDVLHENLSEDIEVGTPLDASLKVNIDKGGILLPKLVEANATATQKKIDLDKSIKNATDTNETLTNTNQSGIQTNLTLQQTIATGKDSIDKINATGNKSLIVGVSEFVNNEYTWTHNMNSEELHITMYDANTKEPLMLDCKPLDKNRVLVRNSVEHPNVKVVLSASFYQGNALFGTNIEEFAGESIPTGAKKVRLKDGNGVVENPITDSDAVFMSDGKTKLTKKMNDVDTQLADMATVNIRQFPRLDSEIDDAPRFQRAFDYLKGKIGIIKLNAERYYFKTKNATGDCFVKVYPNIDLIGIGEKTIIYLDNNTHNGTSGIFKCLDMHDSNYENFVVDTTAITLVDDTDFYDLFYFRYDSTVTTHFNVKIKNVYTKGKAFQSTFNIGTLNDKEVVNFASGLLVENCIIQQQGYATCLNDITYKNVTWVVDLDVLRPSYLNNSTQTPVKFSGKSSFINGAKLLDCKMLVTGTRLPFNPIEVFRTDNGIIDNLEIISTKNGSIVVTSSAGTKLSDYGSVDKETKLTIKNSKLSNVNIVVGELGNVLAENCSFSNCSNLINSTFVEANKENNGVSYTKATFKNVVIYDSCNRLCVSANGKTYISFENCNIYYDRGKSSNGGFNVNPKCEFKIIGTTIWINGTGGGYLLSSSGSDDISFLNTIIMNGNYTSDSTTMLYLTGTHNSIKFINVKNVVRRASTNFLDKSTATISKEIIFNAE